MTNDDSISAVEVAVKALSDALRPSLRLTEAFSEAMAPSIRLSEAFTEALRPSLKLTEAFSEAMAPSIRLSEAFTEALRPSLKLTDAFSEAMRPSMQLTDALAEAMRPSLKLAEAFAEAGKPSSALIAQVVQMTAPTTRILEQINEDSALVGLSQVSATLAEVMLRNGSYTRLSGLSQWGNALGVDDNWSFEDEGEGALSGPARTQLLGLAPEQFLSGTVAILFLLAWVYAYLSEMIRTDQNLANANRAELFTSWFGVAVLSWQIYGQSVRVVQRFLGPAEDDGDSAV